VLAFENFRVYKTHEHASLLISLWKYFSTRETFFRLSFRPREKRARERSSEGNSNIHLLPWQREISIGSRPNSRIFSSVVPFYVVVARHSLGFRFSHPLTLRNIISHFHPLRRENIFGCFLRNTTHLINNTQTMTRFICFPSKVFLHFPQRSLILAWLGTKNWAKEMWRWKDAYGVFFSRRKEIDLTDALTDLENFSYVSKQLLIHTPLLNNCVSCLLWKSLSRDDGKICLCSPMTFNDNFMVSLLATLSVGFFFVG
jgi:hypothetical protein